MKQLIYLLLSLCTCLASSCVGQKEPEMELQQPIENQPTQDDTLTIGGDFFHRAMVMEFTATWCVNCPKMYEAIRTAQAERPNRIIDIAVHYIDEFEVQSGKFYSEAFSISAIPVAVVNLSRATQTSVSSAALLLNSIDKLWAEGQKAAGIKLDTREADGKLGVEVEITLAADGDYRLCVAVLQDGIVKAQTGGGNNYVHNSMLKAMLQEPTSGEPLGECNEKDVISRTYFYPMSSLEAEGKYRVVAYILSRQDDDEYVVNNIAECEVGEAVGYQYESE